MHAGCTHHGAENGTRTRDPHLGKVVLYQLSYFRINSLPRKLNNVYSIVWYLFCQQFCEKIITGLSAYSGKGVDILYFDVRKAVDEFDGKVREAVYELPFPYFVRKALYYLHFEVRKGVDYLNLYVRKGVDDLDPAAELYSLEVAVTAYSPAGKGCLGKSECEQHCKNKGCCFFHFLHTPFFQRHQWGYET